MADDSIRINARLTGDDARYFRELEALEGSATNVIREAVREYHVKRIKPKRNAHEIMTASGFIGGGEGPADLSSRYKEYLAESMLEKYEAGQREARARMAAAPGPESAKLRTRKAGPPKPASRKAGR